jgi:hypothetical protein
MISLAVNSLATSVSGARLAFGGLRPDDPDTLKKTRSLGQLIASVRDKPIHIVYVHGMRADGTGASDPFRKGLCKYVPSLCSLGLPPAKLPSHPLDLGANRPNATYLELPIWRSDVEWQASRPFVDRYIYSRQGAAPVIVDEVNWWPLLFPPKCRFIVHPEIDLSGIDQHHLKLCARSVPPYYPWLTQDELTKALAHKPISAGGARVNAYIKQQIMNWGLTDAVLALGPLRTYFRQAMNLAFDYAAQIDARGIDTQEFVVISESLGSFVVLDAFANIFEDSRAGEAVGERTADLYFFANQFALLQLGRIDEGPAAQTIEGTPRPVPAPERPASPVDLLRLWATAGPLEFQGRPKQVIAFSDPSDLLTYPVPKLRDADGKDVALVVNVYDRNESNWFGLFANPATAHTGHSANDDVLKLIFRTR